MTAPIMPSRVAPVDLKAFQDIDIRNSDAPIFKDETYKERLFLSNGKNKPKEVENKPVTFGEGAALVGKGFLEKTKDLMLLIIDHPVQSIGITALTMGAVMALPLVGVSSAVGASALALGFGGLALFNSAKHMAHAVKHSNEGNYNLLREDLKNVGGECLDLALTLPFAPKAIRAVESHVKHSKGIGINKELISNLKEAEGIGGKYIELAKEDLRIKYDVMASEMGIKVKPELTFNENIPTFYRGFAEPALGKIDINTFFLNPISRMSAVLQYRFKGVSANLINLSPEATLCHEFFHLGKQFSDIARTENIGAQGLKEAIIKIRRDGLPQIEAGIKQAEETISSLNKRKESRLISKLEEFKTEVELIEQTKTLEYLKNQLALSKAMLEPNSNAFNKAFYDDVIKEMGTIKAGTKEVEVTQKHFEGFLSNVDDAQRIAELEARAGQENMSFAKLNEERNKITLDNAFEAPAYEAEANYIKNVMNGRPGIKATVAQANSAAL